MKRQLLVVLTCGLLVAAVAARSQTYIPDAWNRGMIVAPQVRLKAFAFPLSDVRLLESPFLRAMQLDARYLLELEPDRLLHRFRLHAGLPPRGEIYGGWEQESISGHSLGHYLSACALMYSASGDARFKQRVDYIVNELALCQDARRTGYVGGIPGEDTIFAQVARGEIRAAGFDLNGGWVPWYTTHKLMAGLLDAWLHAGNAKALVIASRLGDWIGKELQALDSGDIQRMLACEHGGMNEVLANLYGITGDLRYLELSRKFHHRAMLDPLAARQDSLPGKHANTQIPKIIGCARRYELTADERDHTIAEFFWESMVKHHSYVIGGNSDYESLGEEGKLSDRLSDNTCETCNTYNMLKLTGHLFCMNPHARYADYYERALYNQILASQNPADGMMCYYSPLRPGAKKEYSTKFDAFWCCVGTGMENHAKYGGDIYFRGADGSLYMNLFVPSELQWKEKGVVVRQESRFPFSDTVHLAVLTDKPASISLRIRVPYWAEHGMTISVNGLSSAVVPDSTGYTTILRTWRGSDRITLVIPMSVRTETMPDNPNRIAFMVGPLVLAGALGTAQPDDLDGVPVLVADRGPVTSLIRPVGGQRFAFSTGGIGRPADITLIPYFTVHGQYTSVYWDLMSEAGWTERKAANATERTRRAVIDARTVDNAGIGDTLPERDHNLKGEKTGAGDAMGRKYRHATGGGWFSFDMKVLPGRAQELLCTYWGSDARGRAFDILVDGVRIATQALESNKPKSFFDAVYEIPASLIGEKGVVNVKFQAQPGKIAGGLFGCRILKKDNER